MTHPNRRVYKAPALEKGLEILELLALRQVPMSMTEIAASLGRSGNEIFRMLSVLEQKNYIRRREGSDRFVITNHLFDLGMRVPPTSTLIEHLVPCMRQLADSIRQSCHLSVLSGRRIVVIARVESPSPVGFSVRVGTSRGLLESAAGRVFLAWMSDERRAAIFDEIDAADANGASAESGARKAKPARLEEELAEIREQGYARIPSTFITGITDICVPVAAGDSRSAVAVLTVPYAAGSDAPMLLGEALPLILASVAGMAKDAAVFGDF